MEMSRKRARHGDRARSGERGLARFEVLGRDCDRSLIRTLARRLAEGKVEAAQLLGVIGDVVEEKPASRGGIYAALRRSPLVGSGIDLTRTRHPGRDIDL